MTKLYTLSIFILLFFLAILEAYADSQNSISGSIIGGFREKQDIPVYCATGNHSAVASKILIDKGFKKICNTRYGILNWDKNNTPYKNRQE